MSRTPLKLGAAVFLAMAMWVIPSFGTQGVGTVGRALPHPDRALIAAESNTAAMIESQLNSADRSVREALPL